MSILFLTSWRNTPYVADYFRSTGRDDVFVEYLADVDVAVFIAFLEYFIEKNNVTGVYGTHPFSAPIVSYLNELHGFSGASLESILSAQNKYVSRRLQHAHGLLAPKVVLADQMRESDLSFPVFVKPAIGSSSFLAQKIKSHDELEAHIFSYHDLIRKEHPTHDYFEKNIGGPVFEHMFDFLCEEYIPDGEQITVEGYVQNGKVSFFGITLSCFIEGTTSFDRFEYPYSYGDEMDERIMDATTKIALAHGIDNAVFNVEFRIPHGTNDLYVLEINPRPAPQFLPLVRRVTGIDPLEVMYLLAKGEKIDFDFSKRSGVAVSFVLRREKDGTVLSVPDEVVVQKLKDMYSFDLFNLVETGKKLSDYRQDQETFRYGFVNVYAADFENARKVFEEIVGRLGYGFEDL